MYDSLGKSLLFCLFVISCSKVYLCSFLFYSTILYNIYTVNTKENAVVMEKLNNSAYDLINNFVEFSGGVSSSPYFLYTSQCSLGVFQLLISNTKNWKMLIT